MAEPFQGNRHINAASRTCRTAREICRKSCSCFKPSDSFWRGSRPARSCLRRSRDLPHRLGFTVSAVRQTVPPSSTRATTKRDRTRAATRCGEPHFDRAGQLVDRLQLASQSPPRSRGPPKMPSPTRASAGRFIPAAAWTPKFLPTVLEGRGRTICASFPGVGRGIISST